MFMPPKLTATNKNTEEKDCGSVREKTELIAVIRGDLLKPKGIRKRVV